MAADHDHGAADRPVRHGPYPELTWPAVIVGWLLGSMIALSIGYAALILGFSIEGSELAAILGWGILRGLMRRSSIIENNINQTIASAVNGASAGMMFSVPALFILADQDPEKYGGVTSFSKVLMVLACITGGVLGLAFIIPLRKQMIDFNRLAYPGGIAVAAILKSPGAGLHKAVLLVAGAAVSGLAYGLFITFFGDHPQLHVGAALGLPSFLNVTFFLSLMTIGVGFLSGRGGLVFGYGGFICYFILAPLLKHFGDEGLTGVFDPPPRSAVVVADDFEIVNQAAVALDGIDGPLAARLWQLTERTSGGLFDRAAAEVVVAAGERLIAQSGPDPAVDDQQAAHRRTVGRELLRATRARAVLEAIGVRDGLDTAAAAALSGAGSSVAVIAAVADLEQSGRISAGDGRTLLAATRAQEQYDDVPDALRLSLFRPTGIGMLIGAAIGGIIAAFPLVRSAIRSMQDAARDKGSGSPEPDELPIKLLYGAIVGGWLILMLIAEYSVPGMTWWRSASMAVLGTVWIWIAGVIVSECLGRTNWSPLSGMTLIAVTILILISSGLGDTSSIISSVICGAAICVAIAQAGDMMLDLKSGYLVGAMPKRQQIGQLLGIWLGPILVIVLIFLLHQAYGLGSDQLPAPQGAALASMINGIVGGDVPAWRYAAGAGLGGLLAFSGLGGVGVQVGLGFYMPFGIVLTYTIGCVGRIIIQRRKGLRFAEDIGIPIAAGLIVGEALVGVGNAAVQIFKSL